MRKYSTKKYFESTVIRRYRKVATFVVLILVFSGLLFVVRENPVRDSEKGLSNEVVVNQEAPKDSLSAAYPERIRIPRIGVDATFEEPLGVDANGEIEIPKSFDTVAYYKYGPTPGELGPSVVLGHIDSYKGPAVFYSLGQLKEGDIIEIDRDDGSTAVFSVDRLERHLQSSFPTEKVYGDLNYAGLRLITCSGIFVKGVQRYTHNLIVFACLIDDIQAGVEKLDI